MWLVAALVSCRSSPKEFKSAYQIGQASDGMRAMAFSADARLAAAPSHDFIFVFSTAKDGSSYRLEGARREASSLAFTRDAKLLVSAHGPNGNLDFDLVVWNLETHKQEATRLITQGIDSLAIAGDGLSVAVGCQDGAIRVFDLPNLAPAFDSRHRRNGFVRSRSFRAATTSSRSATPAP